MTDRERNHLNTIHDLEQHFQRHTGQIRQQQEQIRLQQEQHDRNVNTLHRQHADELLRQSEELRTEMGNNLTEVGRQWQTQIEYERQESANTLAATEAQFRDAREQSEGLKEENDGLRREVDRLQDELKNALAVSAQAALGHNNGGQGDRGRKRRRSEDEGPKNVRRRQGNDRWVPAPGHYPEN